MTKRITALLLAILTLISVVGCTNEIAPTESETEGISVSVSETEKDDDLLPANEFLAAYADFDAMKAWFKTNVEDTDTPPVYFTCGSKASADMKWTKTVGESTTVTDYPESDNPVERTYYDITYTAESEQLEITLTVTSYPGYPVIEYDAHLKNLADSKSEAIQNLSCVNTSVADFSISTALHYNKGSTYSYEDYTPYTEKIGRGKKVNLHIENGMASSDYMPYFNLEDKTNSKGIVTAVNWQGNWFADYYEQDGKIVLNAGQYGMKSVMLAGESFKIPGLVMIFYKNGDWQQGQNIWRRWIIEHNLMRYTGRRDYKQNVYLCSGFAGYKADMKSINNVIKTGLTEKYNFILELDAGWYQCDGGWQQWWNTGDYTPSSSYSGDSLKTLSDTCKAGNIGFCLWMEPERFLEASPEAKTLGSKNYISNKTGYALINYGTDKSQDYVVNLVDTTVKTHGLTVYRQDFNTYNQDYWEIRDLSEAKEVSGRRDGATENHACEGYINAWRRIAELNPGLIFDACAAGGRRNDLETLRFSFAHTKSDYWENVTSQQNQNFGSLSWLIFTGTAFADASSTYDIRSRLTLSIGIGINLNKATISALEEWASNQKYMYNDYYQLTEFSSEGGVVALQFNDYENHEGMMVCYLREGGDFTLTAKGLEPTRNYKVWNKDKENKIELMTGEQLMTEGFAVSTKSGRPSAVIVLYEKAD